MLSEIAIDVLNGFEQELITEMSNGNLVIRNLLVRDYPLILHIINPYPSSLLAVTLISGLLIGIPIIVVSVYFFHKRRNR